MGRNIKFRAWWQPIRLEYCKGKLINPPKMLWAGDDSGTKTALDCCEYANQGQNVILLQFTGLFDKNGKEIYEGDILKWAMSPSNPIGEDKFVVEWVNGGFAILYGDSTLWEIIGNKYQNPEL